MKILAPFFSKTFLLCAGSLALSAGTVSAAAPGDVYKDPQISQQWQWFPQRGGINIADVWAEGITGEGVVIGIIDQWVEPFHEDLKVSAYNTATDWTNADLSKGLSYDFMNRGFSPKPGDAQPYPALGHGTACAGMAAAIGGNDVGVVGAAPGATIAGLNASSTGGIYFSDATKYWASGVRSDGTYLGEAEIGIKSCSFGSPFGIPNGSDSGTRITAANNVIYCFAAGNDRGVREDGSTPTNTGWGTYTRDPYVITVASLGPTSYSSFSNYGAGVFISAPGTRVYGTDRTGENGYSDTNYTSWSGTSAATPIVAGVIALGKEIQPDMDVRWAKHALAMSSGHGATPNIAAENKDATGEWAKNNGGYWFNNNYGFGRIDAVGFVEQTRKILYTTVETELSLEGAENIKKVEGTGIEGVVFSFAHSDELSQDIESISVSVEFSAEAVANMDVSSLKVTLYAPDYNPEDAENGVLSSSVLVQGSVGDVEGTFGEYFESEGKWGYTFLTNAFWGSSYDPESGEWLIGIEYNAEDGVDTSDWVTVSSVDFRLGEAVYEDVGSVHEIALGTTAELDTIAVDLGTLMVAGTAQLEDSVFVNGGKFVLAESGVIEAYTGGVFGEDKGVKYVQIDGVSELKGEATFKRGLLISGGELAINGTVVSNSIFSISDAVVTLSGVSSNVTVEGETTLSDGAYVGVSHGATFTVADMTIAAGGLLDVDGGTIDVGGVLEIHQGGTLSIVAQEGDTNPIVLSEGATLTNAGTILISAGMLDEGSKIKIFNGNVAVGGTVKVFGGTFDDGIFTAGKKLSFDNASVDVAVGDTVVVSDDSGSGVELSPFGGKIAVSKAEKMPDGTIVYNEEDVEISVGWAFSVELTEFAEVLVSMNIEAGLALDMIRIFHKDDGEAAEWELYNDALGNVLYNSETGLLSFTTNTFSSYAVSTVPEPSMFGLLAGIGALAFVAVRRRRKK